MQENRAQVAPEHGEKVVPAGPERISQNTENSRSIKYILQGELMNITPGEWKCHPIPDTDGHVWDVETHATSIATVSLSYNTPDNCSQIEANAQLIASAPDMYEALKAVDDYLSAPYPGNMKLKQIAADKLISALAKAEGK